MPIGPDAEAPIIVPSRLSTNYMIKEIRPSAKSVRQNIRAQYESTRAVFMHYVKLRGKFERLGGLHAGVSTRRCLAGLRRAAAVLRLILRTPAE